jgi:hypothetical protein
MDYMAYNHLQETQFLMFSIILIILYVIYFFDDC